MLFGGKQNSNHLGYKKSPGIVFIPGLSYFANVSKSDNNGFVARPRLEQSSINSIPQSV